MHDISIRIIYSYIEEGFYNWSFTLTENMINYV